MALLAGRCDGSHGGSGAGVPQKEGGSIMPWPSAEEQIAAAGVDPNSRLAELIRDNSSAQDIAMLNSADVPDEFKAAPWVLTYWRKQHPEADYSAGDPAGGYPRALRTLYDWMLAHQDLEPESPPEPTPPPEDSGPPK